MKNIFNAVQFSRPKQNKFDLSHEKKMSFKMGSLVPMLVQEVLPGDRFRVNTELLMRLQPMLAPIMHRVRVQTDFFYVPYRLIWDEFEKFITGGEDGLAAPIAPYWAVTDAVKSQLAKGSLGDFLGIPAIDQTLTLAGETRISSLPFRAYQLIWNEYYRDQNLQTKLVIPKTSGNEVDWATLAVLRNRAWEKDYFTSCLPWAQRGGAVSIPTTQNLNEPATGQVSPGGAIPGAGALQINAQGEITGPNGTEKIALDALESVGITINDLRTSARLQEWLEKNARAGSRLAEFILAHFGTATDDLRIGRPQYLGGHNTPVVISEVLSTYQQADDAGYPQGNMTGHGISAGANAGFTGKFKEHGFVFGIMSVLPRTAYMDGLPKMFKRFDKFDYAFPTFAHLGEQEVKEAEVYLDWENVPNQDRTFGYQSRYAEYKYQASTVHGDFRDNLMFWHMARKFNNAPVLNEEFVKSNPDKRVFAVTAQTEDELLCQLYNRVDVLRSLPYFSNPQL